MNVESIRLGIFGPRRKLINVCMTELLRQLHAHCAVVADRVRICVQAVDDADDANWPAVDVLLVYSGNEQSLRACVRFVDRTRPRRLVNALEPQLGLLKSRVDVMNVLRSANVNVCDSLVVDHRDASVQARFIETAESIELDGRILRKPFVEKPADETDHNVRVYWPRDGGALLLFRKSRTEASVHDANCNRVRRDSLYVYQTFVDTGGVDIKVYTLGAHRRAYAESRVAPTAARAVERDPATGKERRSVAVLSDDEHAMVLRAAAAVGHAACGLDVLRDVHSGVAYVCDVNGWSHVYAAEYFERAVAFLIEDECGVRGSDDCCSSRSTDEAVSSIGGVDVHDERRRDVLATDARDESTATVSAVVSITCDDDKRGGDDAT
jgi:hypothetical protein